MTKLPIPPRQPMFRAAADEREIPRRVASVTPATIPSKAPDRAGTPVMVRLQPDLLEKLDKFRGGETRPQAVRRILMEKLDALA